MFVGPDEVSEICAYDLAGGAKDRGHNRFAGETQRAEMPDIGTRSRMVRVAHSGLLLSPPHLGYQYDKKAPTRMNYFAIGDIPELVIGRI
jgi:hypothetical protein